MSSSSVDKTTMKWIENLIDEHSFLPLLADYTMSDQSHLQFGAEVITGLAKVNQRPVAVYAHNNSVNRGYITSQGAKKLYVSWIEPKIYRFLLSLF